MNRKIIIVTSLFCFIKVFAIAQEAEDSIEFEARIAVISKVVKDTIMLRWAPSDALAWQYANDYGYKVERYTMVRDGKLLKKFDKKLLTSQSQTPLPLEKWEQEAEHNRYAAIVAQSIYGETFELDENTDDVYQMINKAEELENRFSFALFCVDQSFKVAQMSGLSFIDMDVKENERYLYKVYTTVPHEYIAVDTGYIFIDASVYTKFPEPTELEAEFSDKSVFLTWNTLYYTGLYSGYIVERSDDGCKNFKRINNNPFVNTTPEEEGSRDFAFYLDTIPDNNLEYCYRVRGITPFGDISFPSDTIRGKGLEKLPVKPYINSYNIINNENVLIEWEFDEEYNIDILGFLVSRSKSINGKYEILNNRIKFNEKKERTDFEYIDPDNRKYLIKDILNVNYIVITAIDRNDFKYRSSPVLVQLEDNDPPAPPQLVNGVIDTSGIVTLIWNANHELDVAGYRIFRSNSSKTEFMQITTDAVTDTSYITEVNLNTLNKYIYYRIVATDFHGNPSEFSEILELKRPDIVPPARPFFTGQSLSDSCIFMEWKNSSSDDVLKTFIKRKNLKNGLSEIIATFSVKDSMDHYCDRTAKPGISYEYVLVVEDKSRNQSETSQNITGKLIDRGFRDEIKNIKVKIDRKEKQITLSWEYDQEDISGYYIYKAFGEIPLRLYKTISGDSLMFVDNNLKINTTYTYRIRAEYENGSGSPFSEPVYVEY